MSNTAQRVANLHVLSWNISSVAKKGFQLQFLINDHKPHLVLLQETYLKPHHTPPVYPDYTWHRHDRLRDKRGGVAILVHKSVDFTPAAPPPNIVNTEIIGGHISTAEGRLYVASVYIPPKKGRKKELGRLLRSEPYLFVAGDLNAHWEPWGSRTSNNTGNYVDHWVNELNLNIHIPSEATRVHPNDRDKDTIVDYALTHEHFTQVEIKVHPQLDSDHKPISYKSSAFNIYTTPNFKILRDWEGIANDIQHISWPRFVLPTPESITEASNLLTSSLQAVMFNNCKVIELPSHHKSLVPRHIRILKREKVKLNKQYHDTRAQDDKTKVNQINRKITSELRKWEEEKKVELLSAIDDPDTRWRAIKQTAKRTSKMPTLFSPNNTPAYSNSEKAELIAESLAERFKELPTTVPNPASDFIAPDPSVHYDVPVLAIDDVRMAILSTKTGTSSGHDGITYRLLKLLPAEGVAFLTVLFNCITRAQFYPDDWKKAVIVPIHKEGKDPHQPSNYRPISLTSCLAKVYEKCLLPHLITIERRLKVIPDHQMGFMKAHSTTHQLNRVTQQIISRWNNKETSIMVTLDVEAAFDKVPHHLLLAKLNSFGFPPWVIAILHSYFSHRSFIVRVDGEISTSHSIDAGTPQGAIWSALLYNIYISDVPSPPSGGGLTGNYADDTCYVTHHKTPEVAVRYMENTLSRLEAWCRLWKVKINGAKSTLMVISRRKERVQPRLSVGGEIIPIVHTSKYLGVIFDDRLLWKPHIDATRTKAKQRTGHLISRLFDVHRLSTETRLILYLTMIRPIMTYGAPCWLGAAISYKQTLERLERVWLRRIFKMQWYVSSDNVRSTAREHILILEDYLRHIAINFDQKCKHHVNPLIRQIGTGYEHDLHRMGPRSNGHRNFPMQITAPPT